MQPDLVLAMEPVVLGSIDQSFHEACTVTSVSDGEPATLGMRCPDGLASLDWRLEATALPASLEALFSRGQTIDLDFSTSQGLPEQEPHQSAILRVPGEADPFLIVGRGSPKVSGLHGSPHVSIATETTCETQPGSCGTGVMRRVAFQLTMDGEAPTIVFDHNDGELGPYRVRVGNAFADEGNCDGRNESWFELVMVRTVP